MHIGILAAMPEELGSIVKDLKVLESYKFGDLEIFTGELEIQNSKKILISSAWSGWGKVSASRAATRLISHSYKNRKVDLVVFTGLAGSVNDDIRQWDVVIADSVMQHDMDASPIFEKFVIPPINLKRISPKLKLIEDCFNNLNKRINGKKFHKFGKVTKGLIATGDMFISEKKKIQNLLKEIPDLLAVEMEGAAFAQVAFQEMIDWLVIRVISDNANSDAEEDFSCFLKQYEKYSWELTKLVIFSIIK